MQIYEWKTMLVWIAVWTSTVVTDNGIIDKKIIIKMAWITYLGYEMGNLHGMYHVNSFNSQMCSTDSFITLIIFFTQMPKGELFSSLLL